MASCPSCVNPPGRTAIQTSAFDRDRATECALRRNADGGPRVTLRSPSRAGRQMRPHARTSLRGDRHAAYKDDGCCWRRCRESRRFLKCRFGRCAYTRNARDQVLNPTAQLWNRHKSPHRSPARRQSFAVPRAVTRWRRLPGASVLSDQPVCASNRVAAAEFRGISVFLQGCLRPNVLGVVKAAKLNAAASAVRRSKAEMSFPWMPRRERLGIQHFK